MAFEGEDNSILVGAGSRAATPVSVSTGSRAPTPNSVSTSRAPTPASVSTSRAPTPDQDYFVLTHKAKKKSADVLIYPARRERPPLHHGPPSSNACSQRNLLKGQVVEKVCPSSDETAYEVELESVAQRRPKKRLGRKVKSAASLLFRECFQSLNSQLQQRPEDYDQNQIVSSSKPSTRRPSKPTYRRTSPLSHETSDLSEIYRQLDSLDQLHTREFQKQKQQPQKQPSRRSIGGSTCSMTMEEYSPPREPLVAYRKNIPKDDKEMEAPRAVVLSPQPNSIPNQPTQGTGEEDNTYTSILANAPRHHHHRSGLVFEPFRGDFDKDQDCDQDNLRLEHKTLILERRLSFSETSTLSESTEGSRSSSSSSSQSSQSSWEDFGNGRSTDLMYSRGHPSFEFHYHHSSFSDVMKVPEEKYRSSFSLAAAKAEDWMLNMISGTSMDDHHLLGMDDDEDSIISGLSMDRAIAAVDPLCRSNLLD